MKILKLSDEDIQEIYITCNERIKKLLVGIYGEEFFMKKITDRVKTFKDAYAIAINLKSFKGSLTNALSFALGYEGSDGFLRSIKACIQLVIITAVLNEGWEPDWSNVNENKYYPWFNMNSGSGLLFDDYVCALSYSAVSSRLCFKSSELAEYAGKQFADIYEEYVIIEKTK